MRHLWTGLLAMCLLTPAAAQDTPPSPPPAPDVPPPPSPKVVWKDGATRLVFDDAYLEIANRVQLQWAETWPADADPIGSFRVRRAKSQIEGWIYSPRLSFELEINWADLGSSAPGDALEDASLDLEVIGNGRFHLRAGQFKVPFGRQQMTSTTRQQFVDRSAVANEFAQGRDQGFEVHGRLFRQRLEWRAGLFNGNGQTKRGNDNRTYQLDARVAWEPFGPVRNMESDFQSDARPRLSLAVNGERNDARGATGGTDFDRRILGADGMLAWRGWFVTAEVYRRELEPEGGDSYRSDGWFAQAGRQIAFDRRLEVAGRYGTWDPGPGHDDAQEELGAAVSWYHNRHALKVQADLRRLTDGLTDTSDSQLRVQVQFSF